MILLVGNKGDLVDRRAVPTEDAIEFAEDQGLFFSETSALSGENVESAFFKLLQEINKVVSKKTLDCGNGKISGNNNGEVALRGSKIDIISGPEMEISEMKKLSSCSC